MSGKARKLPFPKRYNTVTEEVNGVKVMRLTKVESNNTTTKQTK